MASNRKSTLIMCPIDNINRLIQLYIYIVHTTYSDI